MVKPTHTTPAYGGQIATDLAIIEAKLNALSREPPSLSTRSPSEREAGFPDLGFRERAFRERAFVEVVRRSIPVHHVVEAHRAYEPIA